MHSIDTVLPADSVEFCPHPDASNIFVCGTYKLQEEQNPSLSPSSSSSSGPDPANASQNQIRTGQCLVFEVDSEQQEISACVPLNLFSWVFPELQSVYTPLAPKSKRYPSLQSWILNGEKRNFLPSGENGEIEPCPRIRCHTTSNRRPLMAVAKADGSVDLFEWELEQVSYGFIYTNSVCLFSFSPITQNRRNNCFTLAP
jgi:hypothetical protein